MSDLTEFLLARIAEDEAVARKADATRVHIDSDNSLETWICNDEGTHVGVSTGRVLAEVEAKRRIVEEHPDYGGYGTSCATCQSEDDLVGDPWPCVTLRHLATVYNDHDDFQEAWRV